MYRPERLGCAPWKVNRKLNDLIDAWNLRCDIPASERCGAEDNPCIGACFTQLSDDGFCGNGFADADRVDPVDISAGGWRLELCAKAFAGECAAFLALPDAPEVAKQDDRREQGDEDGVQQKHFGCFSLACMRGLCPSVCLGQREVCLVSAIA